MTSGPDGTFSQNDIEDASLANFFARPVQVVTAAWQVGDALNLDFNPWELFFTNKRVSNRIANYNKLRADLHVKVVMTGSAFHYAKALMSYHPLHSYDDFEDIHNANPSDFLRLINFSQRPSIMLEAGGGAGGTMVLPYLHFSQNLSITDGEWFTMGVVHLDSYTTLKHANGGFSPVEIAVYVWATNVHLSVPTATPPIGLSPQMGILDAWSRDEYNGMISGPAGVVEHLAGKLRSAPVIGKYAMATQTIAKNVGSVARFFGFSRPHMPEQPEPTSIVPFPNTCNYNIHDTSVKLALDVKQETTIDPSIVGLPSEDEMVLSKIFQRESYITQFLWPTSAGTEQILWGTLVTPIMMDVSNINGQLGYRMTSLCYGSLPFHYWRGSLIYRFVVAASPYHRGKLTIRYDPRGIPATADVEYNVNYTHIVDIEEHMDFEIRIGWTHTLAYLEFPKLLAQEPADFYPQPVWDSNGNHIAPSAFANGVLEVSVQNCLGVPNTTIDNNVSVLVFVRAGDDYEVAGPDDTNLKIMSLLPQSGLMTDAAGGVGKPDASQLQLTVGSIGTPADICAIHDGDPITSIRQCLKRFNFYNVYAFNFNDWAAFKWTRSDFPEYRGLSLKGIDLVNRPPDYPISNLPDEPTPFNVCRTTLLHYFTPGYAMRRGGLRRQYVFPAPNQSNSSYLAAVWRELRRTDEKLDTQSFPASAAQPFTIKRQILEWFPSSWNATAYTLTDKNPVLTVELPYHNNRRAAPARRVNWKEPAIGLTSHTVCAIQRQDVQSRAFVMDFVSVAEDFQLLYYLGAPVFFLEPEVVTPHTIVGRTI